VLLPYSSRNILPLRPDTIHRTSQAILQQPRPPESVLRIPGSVTRIPESVPRIPESVLRIPGSVPRIHRSVPCVPGSVTRVHRSVPRIPESVPGVYQRVLPYLYNMKYRFITVEGNIGAGKTTLAGQLAAHFNAALLLEQFAENPFLPLFYEDRERYALPLELSFLKDRYRQLQSGLETLLDKEQTIIADYTISKSPLFAKNNLTDREFELFSGIHDMMKTTLPKPDLFIYLHTPIDKLQRQIKKRGRPYEQHIPDHYLIEIENAYLHYFKQEPGNVLWIDNAAADLNEPEYLNRLIGYLESEQPLPNEMVRLDY